MPHGCVSDCKHPLWGGTGVCVSGDGTASGPKCVCDAGFETSDAWGNPSCVRRKALIIGYGIVTIIGVGLILYLILQMKYDLHLPRPARATRRYTLRRRVFLPTSVFVVSSTLLAAAALGRKGAEGLFPGAWFYVFYAFGLPAGNLACTLGAEVWVEALPSQILPAGSIATTLKYYARKKKMFLWMGFGMMASMSVLGCLAPIFGTRKIARVVNLMSIFTATTACVCIFFVGVVLTRIIIRAKAKATARADLQYKLALQRLWLQVAVLCTMGAVWVSGASTLELTRAGYTSPFISLSAMLIDGCVMLSSIVHFAGVPPDAGLRRTSRTSLRDSQRSASFSAHGNFFQGLKVHMSRRVSLGGSSAMESSCSKVYKTEQKQSEITPVTNKVVLQEVADA